MALGFFRNTATRPTDVRWHPACGPYPVRLGDLTLHGNGRYQICGISFDQSTAVLGTRFGNVTLNKRSGAGEELAFTFDEGEVMRFKYVDGQWWKAH